MITECGKIQFIIEKQFESICILTVQEENNIFRLQLRGTLCNEVPKLKIGDMILVEGAMTQRGEILVHQLQILK